MNTTKLMLGQWCSPEFFSPSSSLPFFAPSSYARNSCIVLCLFRVTQDDIPAVQYDRTTHKLALRHGIYIPGSSAPAGHTPPLAGIKHHPVSGRSWLSQTTVHPRRHPT
ncbi:hypothetical protein F4809DRAFT_591157 [Biscogniauxia mediterranea]|nr:hypothetical protein F4809DRAFT_591157 [Biscogniauxia mediterranea]